MKKSMKRIICQLLALALFVTCLAACGKKAPDPVNTVTGTYDEMVAYLKAKGYIAEDATPVDMLATAGYVKDNTDGSFPTAPFADKANDYGGLWLMWWDSATPSEAYTNCFQDIAMHGNTIVYMGGAVTLEPAAYSGNFAIAFGENYDKKDDVLKDFQGLPKESPAESPKE